MQNFLKMAEKKGNIINHTMYSGLVLGTVSSFLLIIGWCLSPYSRLHFIIDFVMIFSTLFCITHFTQQYFVKELKEEVKYVKSVKYGWNMIFYAAVIIAVVTFFFFYLNTDALTFLKESMITAIKISASSEEEAKLATQEVNRYSAKEVSMSVFVGYLLLNFIGILFISLFLVLKKKKNYNNVENQL